ncbi:phospholipid N-methyltransferase PmtA [Candidatus Endowatersipora endosymbiont of Watersipora subatra]|uniref:phospholipid N-methyltransferase PmtA n=1 Tax=Candidatus Endowatersipora endosymbiont of Watersipora subatra TaxID=3077946 RepID=UPI00312CA806
MHSRLTQRLSKHFDNEIRFFRSWVNKPKTVGSVLPTSTAAARKMARVISPSSTAPVLELGPGTGIITRAILERGVKPENLYSVESAREFIPKLQDDFPGVNIIHGDAFHLNEVKPGLGDMKFSSIISGLPLLNFKLDQRLNLLNDLLDRLYAGHPFVQMSYGTKSPIPPNWTTYSVEPLNWVAFNIPPVRLWVYRRTQFGQAHHVENVG